MTPEQQAAALLRRAGDDAVIVGAVATDTLLNGEALERRAVALVADLTGTDEETARRTGLAVARLAAGEHPEPPASWWATPLGVIVAQLDGVITEDAVLAPPVAAAMLGVTDQRVYQLRADGRLTRAPGGVTHLSVLGHLADQEPAQQISIERLLHGLDRDTLLAVREELELLAPGEAARCQDSADRELHVTTLAGLPIDAQTAIAHVDEALRLMGDET